MNRRAIITITIALVIVGIGLVMVPFVSSLNPSERAKANSRIRIEIETIPEVGSLELTYAEYDSTRVGSVSYTHLTLPTIYSV